MKPNKQHLKEYRPASQATRDSWLRTEKPERFLILDPDGNALSSSFGKLKTDASIRALHDKLRRHPNAWFLDNYKNTPLAIYDTKLKKVVEVMYLDDNNYWQFAFNIASLDDNKQYVYMFDIEPKNMTESITEAASQEAYALHRMTDVGQDAAQDFIDANPNINLKKLMSDLVQDKAYRYIVRDIVKGTADKVYVKQFTRKYGALAESYGTSKSVTELVESIVRQTILEMYQPVSFNINVHKTLETGAIDYELDPTKKIVYAYVPFKEESENAVTVPFKKEYIASFIGSDINSQDDLDSVDQSQLDKFVKSMLTRPDKNQILKKVLVTNK